MEMATAAVPGWWSAGQVIQSTLPGRGRTTLDNRKGLWTREGLQLSTTADSTAEEAAAAALGPSWARGHDDVVVVRIGQ